MTFKEIGDKLKDALEFLEDVEKGKKENYRDKDVQKANEDKIIYREIFGILQELETMKEDALKGRAYQEGAKSANEYAAENLIKKIIG